MSDTGPAEPTEPVDATGPTGPAEPTEPVDATGPAEPVDATGPAEPAEPAEPVDATGPTGPAETGIATMEELMVNHGAIVAQEADSARLVPLVNPIPFIATMEELMASHGVIVAKESADRARLAPLLNPTRESYRPQLFAWASAGFPGIYVVQSFTFTPPSVCSDGVVRDVVGYTWYLLGVEIGGVLATIQSMLTGIVVSYSFQGNMLRIHVSRA